MKSSYCKLMINSIAAVTPKADTTITTWLLVKDTLQKFPEILQLNTNCAKLLGTLLVARMNILRCYFPFLGIHPAWFSIRLQKARRQNILRAQSQLQVITSQPRSFTFMVIFSSCSPDPNIFLVRGLQTTTTLVKSVERHQTNTWQISHGLEPGTFLNISKLLTSRKGGKGEFTPGVQLCEHTQNLCVYPYQISPSRLSSWSERWPRALK